MLGTNGKESYPVNINSHSSSYVFFFIGDIHAKVLRSPLVCSVCRCTAPLKMYFSSISVVNSK